MNGPPEGGHYKVNDLPEGGHHKVNDLPPSNLVAALRDRLRTPLPGLPAQLRMAPRPRAALDPMMTVADLRPAAALLLLYESDGDWHVPLTLRGASLRHHGGQVSLPGGRIDPGETAEQTALREAFEEIGVRPGSVDVLGRLTELPIAVSGHLLQPVVGYAAHRPAFVVGEHEVQRIIEVPVTRLRAPDATGWEIRQRSLAPRESMDVPFFDVAGVRVWGATAMVLAELIAILDLLDADAGPA